MEKDFDGWNERKKKIDCFVQVPFFQEREIWWCHLGLNVGFEQNGSGDTYQRPIVVLKKWGKGTCLVLPVTSSNSHHPYRLSIGSIRGTESYAIISQVKTIDARRLTEKILTLEVECFEYIRKTTREYL